VKKIIILDRIKQDLELDIIEGLSDVELFTAYSNEDALRIHSKEKASLIITELYGAGVSARQFCDQVREDDELRDVSIIVCCRDNEIELREARQCRANAVMTRPLAGSLLLRKAREFLSVPLRGRYHVRFSARTSKAPRTVIDCRTENISVTGMLIKADAELRPGDRLLYSLALAPETSYNMQAEVVRNDQGRYGVRFFAIEPAAQRAIATLVSRSLSY
jgi:response regulator RpfG family c-di-GMP phosphodiesterase